MSSGAPVGCLAREWCFGGVIGAGLSVAGSSDGGCCRGLGVVDSPKWASAEVRGRAHEQRAGGSHRRCSWPCRLPWVLRLWAAEVVSDACRGRAGARSPASTPAALAASA